MTARHALLAWGGTPTILDLDEIRRTGRVQCVNRVGTADERKAGTQLPALLQAVKYRRPDVTLRPCPQGLEVPNNIHAVLCTRQKHIHTIGHL